MVTSTTLALPPRGVATRPAAAPAGWRERLQRIWRRVFAPRGRAARADAAAPGYEALAGLDGRLLADIGAPEPLRDRARRGDELRRQRVIDLENGHQMLGWRW